MLALTRTITTLYLAATAVAGYYLGAEKVAIVSGSIFSLATVVANAIPAGRTDWLGWVDAIAAGFAVNVSAKTTGAAARAP